MASFFIAYNIIRYTQLSLTGNFNYNNFFDIWWIPLPLIIAIHLGHKVHVRISESLFKNAIAGLTLVSGVKFLI
jgi:hypothetical protein